MHLPGWDEWIIEVTRKFAHHGYAAIAPHLYFRDGPGSPDDVGARVRAAGGVADAQVVGDVKGAMAYLRAQPNSNGKVGVIGFCSGGRQSYLAGCTHSGLRCGGRLLGRQRRRRRSSKAARRQEAGGADRSHREARPRRCSAFSATTTTIPNREHVNKTEAVLKKLGKTYEFHRYDGAGHAFFNRARPAYRPEQATDGWSKVFAFLKKHLGGWIHRPVMAGLDSVIPTMRHGRAT